MLHAARKGSLETNLPDGLENVSLTFHVLLCLFLALKGGGVVVQREVERK